MLKPLPADSSQSYYHLLGLSTDASGPEIKRAYRRKLKEVHPDTAGTKHAQISIDKLLLAYRTLIDAEMRRLYDLTIPLDHQQGFDFRSFLREQHDDQSRGRLLLFDLLHGHEDEACEYYKTWQAEGFDLRATLDTRDFMDCGYMLAEELYFRRFYALAFFLLRAIMDLEIQKPYFRHFFPEVLHLCHVLIEDAVNEEQVIDWLEDCISLTLLPAKERAWFLKKAASLYLAGNQIERARLYLGQCKALFPGMSGISELERSLSRQQNRMWRL